MLKGAFFHFCIVVLLYEATDYKNKPEQAIELHSNPKKKIDIVNKIRKIFESDQFRAKPDPGQN